MALPFVVAQLAQDYFTRKRRPSARKRRRYPLFWAIAAVAQNALGVVFVLARFAMLILPRQGLFTILIGLAIMNFPGKYAIEQRIIRQPAVAKSLNKIRALGGRPALKVPSQKTWTNLSKCVARHSLDSKTHRKCALDVKVDPIHLQAARTLM